MYGEEAGWGHDSTILFSVSLKGIHSLFRLHNSFLYKFLNLR